MKLALLVVFASAAAAADPLVPPNDASKLECSSSLPECSLVVVSDAAKAALEKLPSHERLMIYFAHSGDAQLASIAKLPWLQRVGVQAGITDLSPIAKLAHIEEVRVVTSASLAPLATIATLRRLSIASAVDFSQLAAFKQVPALDVLMTDCDAACVTAIGGMSWLKSLDIAPHGLGARTLAPLAKLTQLESLRMFDSGLKDVALFAAMKKLRELYLQGNDKLVDISQLVQLPALRRLELTNGNAVHDARML